LKLAFTVEVYFFRLESALLRPTFAEINSSSVLFLFIFRLESVARASMKREQAWSLRKTGTRLKVTAVA